MGKHEDSSGPAPQVSCLQDCSLLRELVIHFSGKHQVDIAPLTKYKSIQIELVMFIWKQGSKIGQTCLY